MRPLLSRLPLFLALACASLSADVVIPHDGWTCTGQAAKRSEAIDALPNLQAGEHVKVPAGVTLIFRLERTLVLRS